MNINTKYSEYKVTNFYTTKNHVDDACKADCMKCLNCEFGHVQYEIINNIHI